MEWIDIIILGLVDTYGTNDVYEICDCLNIKIIKLDPESPLLFGNEAFYHRSYFGTEIIFIRNDIPLQYEKFILGHELCHAIVHTEILQAAFSKDLINKGKLERQANYFAFKLNNIKLDEIQLYEMTIEQISSCLELPERALKQLFNNL